MKNIISKYINVQKPHKILTESDSSDEIKVYMNTWANYSGSKQNDSGHLDLLVYGIDDGWMTPSQAKEFAIKYAEDEPFINDTDNCPIPGVNEYSGLSVLDDLIKIEELPDDEREMVGYFFEHGSYKDLDDIISKIQSGDYIFFPGVDNNTDLGQAYFDMVGIGGISNPFQYVDRDQIMRSFRDNDFEEDLSDDDYYAMADEEIENAEADGNLQYAEDNFDYEALGRDLEIEGYTYVSGGALMVF